MVLGRVHRNAVKPRIERALPAEARQCPVSLDKGFLDNVFHFFLGMDVTGHETLDLVLVTEKEQVERATVAPLHSPDQFSVGVRAHPVVPFERPTAGACVHPGAFVAHTHYPRAEGQTRMAHAAG